jgi:hypothetical protein
MGLPNAGKPAKLPAEPASKTPFFGHGKARVRVLAAMLLAVAAVALMVLLDLKVANVAWRLVGLFCASILAVAIVLLLPADWRKRLGTGTATFVAAAGVLSVFLATPSTPPPAPAVDAQAMAHYVAEGPFDQQLPQGLLAGPMRPTSIGDPSAAGKLNATQIPIEVPSSSPLASAGMQIYAEVEVYPSASAAARRGRERLKFYGQQAGSRPPAAQTIAGFCDTFGPSAWVCAGVRGNAYAETTLSPSANAFAGLTQDITSAMLSYAADKAKLATH